MKNINNGVNTLDPSNKNFGRMRPSADSSHFNDVVQAKDYHTSLPQQDQYQIPPIHSASSFPDSNATVPLGVKFESIGSQKKMPTNLLSSHNQ